MIRIACFLSMVMPIGLPAANVSLPPPGAYLVNWSGTTSAPEASYLWRVDLSTGEREMIGDTGVSRLNSLSAGPDGKLLTASGSRLYEVDAVTGRASPLFSIPTGDVRGIACSPEGQIYVTTDEWVIGGVQQGGLYRIDLTAETATRIGGFVLGVVQGLTFSLEGRLTGWHLGFPGQDTRGLVALDTATGSVVDLAISRRSVRLQSIEYDVHGGLFGVHQNALYEVNEATGETTRVGGDYDDVRGMAIVGVPEPTPGMLLLVALGGTLLRRRRV